MADDQFDLLKAFMTYSNFRAMMTNKLLPALRKAESTPAAVLALEGLFRIEGDVKSKQFKSDGEAFDEAIRTFLRKWRCESPLSAAYEGPKPRVTKFLRNLTIFETFEVPLFIDNLGKKKLMSDYQHHQRIDIKLDTPIVHVTHSEEKDRIVESEEFIVPSKNKNIIEGIWFSPKSQLGNPYRSVYGSWAFETTLGKLGVVSLRQGEIVSYKGEVNFILYASDQAEPIPFNVQRATDDALKLLNKDAYAAVSIFVPSRVLPEESATLKGAFGEPRKVLHGHFCVKQKRSGITLCEDLEK